MKLTTKEAAELKKLNRTCASGKATRKQLLRAIDLKSKSLRAAPVVCRTCGVEGCCILAHDNLRRD
jgi:hypothetical protein